MGTSQICLLTSSTKINNKIKGWWMKIIKEYFSQLYFAARNLQASRNVPKYFGALNFNNEVQY